MRAGRRRGAFTLIEVLVAVVILAFTATAALKLVMLAQDGLFEAKRKRGLLDEAVALQTGIKIGETDSSGTSGDITWEVEEMEREGFEEDFGRLGFETGSGDAKADFDTVQWKELRVTKKYAKAGDREDVIILYLPSEIKTASVSKDIKSKDKK